MRREIMRGASAHAWQLMSSHDFVVVHGGRFFCGGAWWSVFLWWWWCRTVAASELVSDICIEVDGHKFLLHKVNCWLDC